MAAKTTSTETSRKDGIIQQIPMIASETIYKGSTVMVNSSSGYAFTNDGTTNTLSAGDIFAGIAVEEVTSGGTAGVEHVRVYRDGSFLLTFSDTLTQANVGDRVYVNNTSDDAVVTITSDPADIQASIGQIVEFVSASTAYVSIDKSVGYIAKIGSLSDNTVDTNDITAAAVTLPKLSYELKTVQITGATSGTATVVAGGQILGWYVTAITSTATVKTVAISSTTLTVTLSASDTATVMVMVMKA